MVKRVVTVGEKGGPGAFSQLVWEYMRQGRTVIPVPPGVRPERYSLYAEAMRHKGVDPGIMFATSGTVGASKLVIRSEVSVLEEAQGVSIKLGLRPGSRVLIGSPITHSFGFGMLMAAVEAGASVFYAQSPNVFERLNEIRRILAARQIDVMTAVPFVYRRLLREPKGIKAPTMSYAGGEPVDVGLINDWNVKTGGILRQEYGLSEVGIVSFASIDDPPDSIGTPVPGCWIRTMPDQELCVFRAGNPVSYALNDHPATFSVPGGVLTGDQGYLGLDGAYVLTGRKSSVVFIAGQNVVPEEVETIIRRVPAVEDVFVRGEEREKTGENGLVAYVMPVLSPKDKARLKKELTKLDKYKIPRIVEVHELPRTAAGKVQRSAL